MSPKRRRLCFCNRIVTHSQNILLRCDGYFPNKWHKSVHLHGLDRCRQGISAESFALVLFLFWFVFVFCLDHPIETNTLKVLFAYPKLQQSWTIGHAVDCILPVQGTYFCHKSLLSFPLTTLVRQLGGSSQNWKPISIALSRFIIPFIDIAPLTKHKDVIIHQVLARRRTVWRAWSRCWMYIARSFLMLSVPCHGIFHGY